MATTEDAKLRSNEKITNKMMALAKTRLRRHQETIERQRRSATRLVATPRVMQGALGARLTTPVEIAGRPRSSKASCRPGEPERDPEPMAGILMLRLERLIDDFDASVLWGKYVRLVLWLPLPVADRMKICRRQLEVVHQVPSDGRGATLR